MIDDIYYGRNFKSTKETRLEFIKWIISFKEYYLNEQKKTLDKIKIDTRNRNNRRNKIAEKNG